MSLFPITIGASIVAFLIMHMAPGDPARVLVGPEGTQEDLISVRIELGLDQPLHVQYLRFARGIIDGSLKSMKYDVPTINLLWERLKNTSILAFWGMAFAIVLGISAGVLSAVKRYSWIDYISTSAALVGVSMPSFWLALIMILCFAVNLRWLPSSGMGTWRHVIMPSIVLGCGSAGIIARMTRSSMLDVMCKDYIVTARSKGLRSITIVMGHALRNAMIPTVAVIGLQIGSMLAGAVLVESVFAWPGVGRLLVDSVLARDYPMVQTVLLAVAMIFVMTNLVADLMYGILDPRLRNGA